MSAHNHDEEFIKKTVAQSPPPMRPTALKDEKVKLWINIRDRHPEFDVPVIVSGEGRICIARLQRTNFTKESTTFDFLEGDIGVDELWITPKFWMPIPENPALDKL